MSSAQRRYDNELPDVERPVCAQECRCGSLAVLFGDETEKNVYALCAGCGRRAYGNQWTFEDAENDWERLS